jgi:hypothetical protein
VEDGVFGAFAQFDLENTWKFIAIALTGFFGILGLLTEFKKQN